VRCERGITVDAEGPKSIKGTWRPLYKAEIGWERLPSGAKTSDYLKLADAKYVVTIVGEP